MRLEGTERDNRRIDSERYRRAKSSLGVTASGFRYIHSIRYVEYMDGRMTRFYELDASFFGLLVGITATFLSGTDPNSEDIDAFDGFVSENIAVIRSAIDRIKDVHAEIGLIEEMWERAYHAETIPSC